MNDAINRRLAVLETYYAEIAREERTAREVIETYEGMLSQCPNGEGSEAILIGIDRWEGEIVQLKLDRAEIDRLWNEVVS